MSAREDDFLASLRATFRIEAGEHVQTIAAGLLALERTSAPEERRRIIETIYRAAHSLKGAARAVNFHDVESICQSMEDAFATWKRNERTASSQALDAMHRSLDAVTHALGATSTHAGAEAPVSEPRHGAPHAAEPALPPAPAAEGSGADKTPVGETVRIAVDKLDARLLEAEEMLAAKLMANQRAIDLRELTTRFEEWRKEWTLVQPDVRALRQAMERGATAADATPANMNRLIEFFEWNHDYLRSFESRVEALSRAAAHDNMSVGKLVDDLLADSKKLLMLPLATLGTLFPKLVRDLCRDQGKEADLIIEGEDVEIDKRILEEMKDPFIHLLRNCVDHGVELPDVRVARGKPARATIRLSVTPVNGSKVELVVSDDGAGIDVERVKSSAVAHGLISAGDARSVSDAQAHALIFQADVTASPMITQLSGRGLGLAIVRERAEKLGGTVSVESRAGKGTRFRILLPSMLATFRGILVQASGRTFVVPTTHVARVMRAMPADVQTVEGRETIAMGGRAVSFVRLAHVLELPVGERREEESTGMPIVVLAANDQHIGFGVDAVLDEQEVLVKRLASPLARVRNVAGATVLSSGQVAPILNVPDLFKSARKIGGAGTYAPAEAAPVRAANKSVLVVEDSITSRMLLKGILESAGYDVKTAVDGMEAFTLLRAEAFDLVVSDVEMPRLNGFELTRRIRADKKLAEMPIVLVTALETREDRERGIDVGANAYIVKSSFDQSNLLDAVRRLS